MIYNVDNSVYNGGGDTNDALNHTICPAAEKYNTNED